MKETVTYKKQKSLVSQFNSRLLFCTALLVLMLVVRMVTTIFSSTSQSDLSAQKSTIQKDMSNILSTMIDQETGLRGYITTRNLTFLQPYKQGHAQYLNALQHLEHLTNNKSSFKDTSAALTIVSAHADDWYTNFAQVQLKDMQMGRIISPSNNANLQGKALFDSFRNAMARLQLAVDHDLNDLQNSENFIETFSLVVATILSLLAIVVLWFTFAHMAKLLRKQLDLLTSAVNQISADNLVVRVQRLSSEELNLLGRAFNSMAQALQRQRNALAERDIMENVLQLNTILTSTPDFATLTNDFLDKLLTVAHLQFATLYLYESQKKQFKLSAALGVDFNVLQQTFQEGEGIIGRAVIHREPIYLTHLNEAPNGMEIKTILGNTLPTDIYQLPLTQGDNLLGVLAVGSLYPMTEKARHILNVIGSNLASILNNVRAYQHIQVQAEELAARIREQERANTMLRQQRDELSVLNQALEEANRTRSQFLSTMSHELRTPLASIIGFSQILLSDPVNTALSPRQRKNIERILKNGKHLLLMINDVLDLSKIDSGRMDVNVGQVNLRELISSVVEETQSLAIEQKLNLTWEVEDEIEIETDQLKLRQVLLNLLSNALKFTHEGNVSISARRIVSSTRGEKLVSIAVKDTGIGITPEHQEHIFEAFYQTDSGNTRKFGGTGLGLAIVRQLTTLLDGILELQSEPGEGSTFLLTLPTRVRTHETDDEDLASEQKLLPRLVSTSIETTDRRTDTPSKITNPAIINNERSNAEKTLVLSVDDNLDALNLIKAALDESPYRVIGVQDPLQVMALARNLHPSAITLDVMMADMNGWQLLYELKTNPATSSIPIIMLTVLAERTTGYVLGANEYLVKPFNRDVLLSTLDHLIGVIGVIEPAIVNAERN